jgi:Mrp family chromosome partitioning ATPase
LDSEVNGLPLLADDEDTHGTSDHSGTILLKQLSSKKPTKEHQSKAVSLSTGGTAARKKGHKTPFKSVLKKLPARALPQGALTPPVAAAGEQETHRTLSQKYRPQSFKEVVGQSMVIKSLSTSIMKGKVAPVYLFMGPRGTGKTTTARIFAAALNCCSSHMEQWPCRNCQECKTISLNSSQDVKEIDASNNADIESMRAMLGTFSPSHSRYKVIIVDGCDYLTTEVWNAFLKVLEEPPKNLVFILITTEVKHLPLTVISR